MAVSLEEILQREEEVGAEELQEEVEIVGGLQGWGGGGEDEALGCGEEGEEGGEGRGEEVVGV